MAVLDTLSKSISDGLSAYARADGDERVGALRAIAWDLVEARQHFTGGDGLPDWQGRTHAYRMWVRSAIDASEVDPADRAKVTASVRYHVGAEVRARLSPEELEAMGLRVESPRQRAASRREHASEVQTLVGPGAPILEASDVVALAALIDVSLRRVPTEARKSWDFSEDFAVDAALKSLRSRIDDLLGRTDNRVAQPAN